MDILMISKKYVLALIVLFIGCGFSHADSIFKSGRVDGSNNVYFPSGPVRSLPVIPNAASAKASSAINPNHSSVINKTPSQGVTADRVAKAIAQNNQTQNRNILSTYASAKRRYR